MTDKELMCKEVVELCKTCDIAIGVISDHCHIDPEMVGTLFLDVMLKVWADRLAENK